MSVKVQQEDFKNIQKKVITNLRTLLADYNIVVAEKDFSWTLNDAIFVKPLRVSTHKTEAPSTEPSDEELKTDLYNHLKKEIESGSRPSDVHSLNTVFLLGQLIFSQSSGQHYIDKCQSSLQKLKASPELINGLNSLKKYLEIDSEKPEKGHPNFLEKRKNFSREYDALQKQLKEARKNDSANEELYSAVSDDLSKAKQFFYQMNDFNYRHADKIYTKLSVLSRLANKAEQISHPLALVSIISTVILTALSFVFPPLIPCALAANAIMLGIMLPPVLYKIGTMVKNYLFYDVAPTKEELVNSAAIGFSVATVGIGFILPVIGIVLNASKLAISAAGAAKKTFSGDQISFKEFWDRYNTMVKEGLGDTSSTPANDATAIEPTISTEKTPMPAEHLFDPDSDSSFHPV